MKDKPYRKIFGYNKRRDGRIILKYARHRVETDILAKEFNLTETRIDQILINNKVLIPVDKETEKFKAILRTKKKIRQLEKIGTKKDVLEWEQYLHKLIEGDKPLIDQSQHITTVQQIEIFVDDYDRKDKIKDTTPLKSVKRIP